MSSSQPATGSQPAAEELAARAQELGDSLIVRKAILASLLDVRDVAGIGEKITNAKNEIQAIQKDLSDVRRAQQKVSPPKANTALPRRDDQDPFSSASFTSGTSTPSMMSTHSAASSVWDRSAQQSLPSRKRSFGSHLDIGHLTQSGGKHRKATPSPARSEFTAPSTEFDRDDDEDSVIDLTGNDDEYLIDQQKLQWERIGQNKKRLDSDAELARSLQARDSSPSPAPGPSGTTAFDRILPRSSQSSRPGAAGGSFASQTTGFSTPEHAPGPRIKSEAESRRNTGSADRRGASTPAQRVHGSSASNYWPMPDSYEEFDSSDDDDEVQIIPPPPSARKTVPVLPSLSGSSPIPPSRGFPAIPSLGPHYPPPQSSTHFSPAPPPPPGYGRGANLQYVPGVPASELARRAALQRQGFSQGAAAHDLPWASSAWQDPLKTVSGPSRIQDLSRPGSLHGGAYAPLQPWASPWGSSFIPGPQLASQRGGSDVLGNVINSTSGYDFNTMTDALGNPLSDRLRNFYGDLVDDPRKTQEEIKDLLSTIRPDMDLPEEQREGTPEAMRYALYPHQQLALQWMKDKEDKPNKGGILADDMGLGKTVSTIALMVTRQAPDNVKTNLIIGPVALIKQWESEIKKKLKAENSMSVFLLHGKKVSYQDLRRYDVVLTTYGTVAQECRRMEKWRVEHPTGDAYESAELARSCPLLHPRSRFYRVILDEAQCIKNHNTQSAKGAYQLNAKYRWCLTGTPMMNGVHELYSLIHFLKIRPYSDQKTFNRDFGSLSPKKGARQASEYSRDAAMQKLRAVLKAIMLRRMKNSEIDGKPILNLPPKTEESAHVVFSEDEQSFYTELETKSQVQFSKYLRAGTIGKNYSNVLVLLLRLRQACCHPHLNLDFDVVEKNDAVSTEDMTALALSLEPSVVARLKAIEAFECPICLDATANPSIAIPCGHDTCPECLTQLTDNSIQNGIQAGQEGGAAKCPQCRGPIVPEKVINYTIFKKVHMPDVARAEGLLDEESESAAAAPETGDHSETASEDDETESEEDEDGDDDDDDDDDADQHGNLLDFVVPDSDADDDHVDNKPKKSKLKKSKKGKGKEKETIRPSELKHLRQEARKNKDAHRRYMRYLRDNWQPSAKVTKCVELLEQIQKSDEKTIVFSQWTGLLDLLEIQIKYSLGLKYRRYDGSMSSTHRQGATRDFMEDPRVKVMLVSLKAGNAGLNLTAASQIIILDPFWNPYIEMQAVDRAHRIGQQRPVQVHRILVATTVEDRIIDLQEKKRQLVDAALDEGESKNMGRLSVRELCYLFNVSR